MHQELFSSTIEIAVQTSEAQVLRPILLLILLAPTTFDALVHARRIQPFPDAVWMEPAVAVFAQD